MDGRFIAQHPARRMRDSREEESEQLSRERGSSNNARAKAMAMVDRYTNGIKASGATRAGQAVGRFVERMRGKIQERRARAGERAQEAPGGAVSRERRPDDARQG